MNPETNDERGVEFLKTRASLVVFRKRYECFLDNLLMKILNYPLCSFFFPLLIPLEFMSLSYHCFSIPFLVEG